MRELNQYNICVMHNPLTKMILMYTDRLEVWKSLSPRLHTITFPDSGQNRGGKKVIYEGAWRSKIQRVRKQLWTCVVFLCSVFLLAPVKQETLKSTSSLKEKQE